MLVLITALVLKLLTVVLRLGDVVIDTHLLPLPPKKDTIKMIQESGYPLEIHGNLVTEDEYILEMHRIPYSIKDNAHSGNRTPVLLTHGLMACSTDWVLAGPERALAYKLVDQGYDVWMANVRGNTYSRKHMHFRPDLNSENFWNFGFQEIALYDLSLMIDYVLEKTGHQKLHYIGHSQGTSALLILLSEKPEYNNKMIMVNLLAPVAFMSNVPHPFIRFLAPQANELEKAAWDTFHLHEFVPKSSFLNFVTSVACHKASPLQGLCPILLFAIVGFNPGQYDDHLSSLIFQNYPAGSSLRQFLHFAQLVESGHFRQYDYFEKNMDRYGQANPPDYNVTNIIAPIGLHYAKNDLLSSPKDVSRLIKILPNVVIDNLLPPEKFNHLDFLFAKDIDELLYNSLVKNMTNY